MLPATFGDLRPISENEVSKLTMNSKSTTCELDVIPIQKLKYNLNLFIPIVTDIVNKSLTSGSFPNEWKGALIKPLLKKKGLPLEP